MLVFDNSEHTGCLNVYDGWMYYCSSGGIYKVRVDGTENKCISSIESTNINILGDWIFYNNPNDNNKIYRMNIDGGENTKIGDVSDVADINLAGEWIIYNQWLRDQTGGFLYCSNTYMMKLDGTDNKIIGTDYYDFLE